ncbi:MAG TPA: hypothetical protein VH325_02415 [Bryobacteraceae bacterium]|jgi:hypothetical protein|nr:hypothetical protein [Bryobacteraceae bacterium]
MDSRQKSLAFTLYASLAVLAAGMNFYWTVEDTPLAAAMRAHSTLSATWNLVRLGALLALIALTLVAVPLFLTIMRTAAARPKWNVILRLAVPPCAVLIVLIWLVGATKLSGAHWVPTPWDVAGDWTAPAAWPSLPTRVVLSCVTFLLLIIGLVVSAISVRQVIAQSDLSGIKGVWFVAPSLLFATSVVVMSIGVSAWGWFVQQYAAYDFHTRNGGLFTSTNFTSWAASCLVYLLATATAVQSARSALHGTGSSADD